MQWCMQPPCSASRGRAPTFPSRFAAYRASKAQAEPLVLAANRPGFRTIALRPAANRGSGDPFSRALPEAVRSGRFAFIDCGDHAFATYHVNNVVEAIPCALERGEGDHAYLRENLRSKIVRDIFSWIRHSDAPHLGHRMGLLIDIVLSTVTFLHGISTVPEALPARAYTFEV